MTATAELGVRACHELRGALGTVRMAVAVGDRAGGLTGPQLRALDVEVERAGVALGDLEEALGLRPAARGEAGASVAVGELLADVVAACRPAAEHCGRALSLCWTGADVAVWAPRGRLAQAVENLIVNALEHGAGTVAVRGGCEGGTVRIEVVDDGPGLAAPVAELSRGSGRRGEGEGGMPRRGHGLAIASGVAGACGGRLSAAPVQHGARLLLTLPACAPSPARRAALNS